MSMTKSDTAAGVPPYRLNLAAALFAPHRDLARLVVGCGDVECGGGVVGPGVGGHGELQVGEPRDGFAQRRKVHQQVVGSHAGHVDHVQVEVETLFQYLGGNHDAVLGAAAVGPIE